MSLSKPSFREKKRGWYAWHRIHVNNTIRRQAKVIILGDSLVANLSRYPSVWDHHFRDLNAVNCGIGGDCAQHVLWRADNFYLPGSVSAVVIHCGTNNLEFNVFRPHDIAHCVIACGTRLRDRFPHLKVIVAGILPRDIDVSKRNKIQQTNDLLKTFCLDEDFHYIEQAGYWTNDSGDLNQSLFWKDNLHLSKRGCNMFAEAIANAIIHTSQSTPSPPSAHLPPPTRSPPLTRSPPPTLSPPPTCSLPRTRSPSHTG